MPVIEGTPCRAIFSYPRNCNATNCIYVAQWDYNPDTDDINFIIQSNRLNTWTGIGFSEAGEMAGSDVIVGWVGGEGRATITDRFATGYTEPQRDFSQDISRLGGAVRYGTQLITFSRKRITGDDRDFQFNDTSCPYLIFPVFGGTYDELSEVIDKHEEPPVISDQPICIRACRKKPTSPPMFPFVAGFGSGFSDSLDKNMILLDPSAVSALAISTPSANGLTTYYTRSYSRDRTVNFHGIDLFTKNSTKPRPTAPRRTHPQTPANFTYRAKNFANTTPLKGMQDASGKVTSAVDVLSSTLSPDDELKKLLAEAGISGVSIEVVSQAKPPAPPSPPKTTATSPPLVFTPTSPKLEATIVETSKLPPPSNQSLTQIAALTSLVLDRSSTYSPTTLMTSPAIVAPPGAVLLSVTGQTLPTTSVGPSITTVPETKVHTGQIMSSAATVPATQMVSSAATIPVTSGISNVTIPAFATTVGSPETMHSLGTSVGNPATISPFATIVGSPATVVPSVVPMNATQVTSGLTSPYFTATTASHGNENILVIPPGAVLQHDSHPNEPPVRSSDNTVSGVNHVALPSDSISNPRSQTTFVGPLPSTITFSPAISMTPSQMLTALMGLTTGNISTVSSAPFQGPVPLPGVVTSSQPTRQFSTIKYPVDSSGPPKIFDMEPSMMIPSILPAPATQSTQNIPQNIPPFAIPEGAAPVMVSSASDVVTQKTSSTSQSSSVTFQGSSSPSNFFVAEDNHDHGVIEDDPLCGQRFRYPSNCQEDNCTYAITWRPGSNIDEIEFIIDSNNPNFWTGIGFSDDKLMKDSDIIYAFIRPNGYPRTVDAYAKDYERPYRDTRNDVRLIDGGRRNNRAFFHFARKLITHDPYDYEFGQGRCPFFKFPIIGSTYDPNTLNIEKHQRTPIVSQNRVCLKACDAAVRALIAAEAARTTTTTTTTTTAPAIPGGAPQGSTGVSKNKTVLTAVSGKTQPNTADADKTVLSCIGEFRYPDNCGEDNCDYIAQWEYLPATDEIKFDIATSHVDEWTGIGFNDKNQMALADVIYGWMEDGGPVRVVDAYIPDSHQPPVRDLRQDAKNLVGKATDRLNILTFTRKRITKDDRDFQFNDTKCPYFIFPVRGGDYDLNSMMILKHKSVPLVSTARVCITSDCAKALAPPVAPESRKGSAPVNGNNTIASVQLTVKGKGEAQQGKEGLILLSQPSFQLADISTIPPNPDNATSAAVAATTAASYATYMPCEGTWKYPENCLEPNCIYVASWNYLDDSDSIRFVVKAKATGWTGIGFNDDPMMKNADAIVGWVTSKSTVVVTDRHCEDNTGCPMDEDQSVADIAGRRENGYQIIEFTRKRDTQDANGNDYIFGDQKCPFFLFPIVGGSYDNFGGIQAHSQKALPRTSPARICVRSCNIDVPRRMVVSFKIINRSWQKELGDRSTPEFQNFEKDLSDTLRNLLGSTPGFRGTKVLAFRAGSVIADVEITIDPTANQTSSAGAKTMQSILITNVKQKGQLGPYSVDKNSLTLSAADPIILSAESIETRPLDTTTTLSSKAPDSEVRTYAIVGGVIAIVAILFFLAFGKMWYERKSRAARRQERAKKLTSEVIGGVQPPNPQYSRRQTRNGSLAIQPDVFSIPKPPYDPPHQNGKMRNGLSHNSLVSRTSASLPPPDYFPGNSVERPSRRPRKVQPPIPLEEDQKVSQTLQHRLSLMDESDRTLTTYSSNNSRKDPNGNVFDPDLDDWGSVDEKYHRPPDFYFMPSQRRWTQVPQGF